MILFPYNNDPATGSLMPSISTGGAAKKEAIKTKVKIKNKET